MIEHTCCSRSTASADHSLPGLRFALRGLYFLPRPFILLRPFIAASNARNGRWTEYGSMAANILAWVAREP
jgi:hypothetical protein